MRLLAPALCALLVAGCATQASEQAAGERRAERDARTDQQLAKALEGLRAGVPVNCISLSLLRPSSSQIGDRTILYRANTGVIYRNDPPNGCPGMRSSGTTLISRTPTTQLCRGEVVQVVDLVAGVNLGGCALGNFVPYEKDDAADRPITRE